MAILKFDLDLLEGSLKERLDKIGGARERILDQAASNALHRIQYRFLHEQRGAHGEVWKQSDAAKRRLSGKDKKLKGGDTLFRYGDLFRSIQVFEDGDEASRSIGTDLTSGRRKGDKPGLLYGLFHQFGKGDMYRPFLGLNQEDKSDLDRLIRYHLDKIVGNDAA